MIGSVSRSELVRKRQFAREVGFQLDVIWKDEDILELRIAAWHGAFGGVAGVWVGIGELESIAAKLSGFPKDPSDAREVVLGSFGPGSAGGAASMRFYCADRAGHAYVESKIESEGESAGVVQCAVISMPVEAAAVDAFVDDLRRLERDRTGTALLKGMG
jgi:hypothetical protein